MPLEVLTGLLKAADAHVSSNLAEALNSKAVESSKSFVAVLYDPKVRCGRVR